MAGFGDGPFGEVPFGGEGEELMPIADLSGEWGVGNWGDGVWGAGIGGMVHLGDVSSASIGMIPQVMTATRIEQDDAGLAWDEAQEA